MYDAATIRAKIKAFNPDAFSVRYTHYKCAGYG
jgi:hypothetical protein